jgi:hypothetical protein
MSFKRLKTGASRVSWRRNGLKLVGKGASDRGSVGIDFRDCALYPDSQIDTAFGKAAVVRDGNVYVHQPDQRRHKAFGLPERQMENLTNHQATLNGQL